MLLGIWDNLNRYRRFQLCLLAFVMLASGLAELVSLGAVIPFLAVLANPQQLWQQPLINSLVNRIGLTDPGQLLLPATLVFMGTSLFAGLIRLANLWLNVKLAAAVGSDLSCEAFRCTLYQPYEVHVQRNSSAVITSTTTQIGYTVAALNAFLQLVTSIVVSVFLLTGLLIIDAFVALGIAVLFGTVYLLLALTARRELRRNGQKISVASAHQLKILQEGLGAIRDILLDNSQEAYFQVYRQTDGIQRNLQAKNTFLANFPRYGIEALGLMAIALLGYFIMLQRGSGAAVIPLMGAMALGAQRLLPALQQIYGAWASLKGYNSAIGAVLQMVRQPLPALVSFVEPLALDKGISLENVHFRYSSGQFDVLRGVNLEIRPGDRIGLIGNTGSGKSTMVDLLMGLLAPSSGKVLVDASDLHDPLHPERLAAWRASIAHVPQSIYLSDNSIYENIAFGVAMKDIDRIRVEQAAEQAQIASFIKDCPNGYQTVVGERGTRLSGGQCQRIGIARALYKQARVLVFDEATSALDYGTEDAIIKQIDQLHKELTIIMIAHRLSTVQNCNRVITLDNGIITADGSPPKSSTVKQ